MNLDQSLAKEFNDLEFHLEQLDKTLVELIRISSDTDTSKIIFQIIKIVRESKKMLQYSRDNIAEAALHGLWFAELTASVNSVRT